MEYSKVKKGEPGSASSMMRTLILRNGGATSPTVEVYQLASGRCRVWWYAFAPSQQATIAVFYCDDWERAKQKGLKKYNEFKAGLSASARAML